MIIRVSALSDRSLIRRFLIILSTLRTVHRTRDVILDNAQQKEYIIGYLIFCANNCIMHRSTLLNYDALFFALNRASHFAFFGCYSNGKDGTSIFIRELSFKYCYRPVGPLFQLTVTFEWSRPFKSPLHAN